jgi:hypothetical protein
MTSAFDVAVRLEYLRQEHPGLALYCLLDGAQYLARRGKRFAPRSGAVALFMDTPDEALAFAGPWLIETDVAGPELVQELIAFERAGYGVSWLIAYQDLRGLAQILRLHLEAALPDGRQALVRFWDTRVLANLAEVLDAEQRRDFFGHIVEWHLMLNREQRVMIGRRDV